MKAFLAVLFLALCASVSAFGHFEHDPDPVRTPTSTPTLSPTPTPDGGGGGGGDDGDDGGLWEGPCTVCPAEEVFRKCPTLSMEQCNTDPDCTWCTSPAGTSTGPECRVGCTCGDPTGTGPQDETTLLFVACRYQAGVATIWVPSWRGCECEVPAALTAWRDAIAAAQRERLALCTVQFVDTGGPRSPSHRRPTK
eukprot:CAMPEP_0119416322 /NCGR_PEP_ID=MMETSP1335-20130426/12528_1 /TAXON_ID=259385 /ORGANISM="Chrysoculter rhomboideus, Strain RCC1486" /LENGTH=194 /DNA_ID=CAMNT_0007441439 /DNA_START=27 /DNA_END=610 /DNA_ORIENTATION=+